jgi:hypothetical protein
MGNGCVCAAAHALGNAVHVLQTFHQLNPVPPEGCAVTLIKNEAGRLVLLGTAFSRDVFGLGSDAGTSLDTNRTPEFAGVSDDCSTTLTFPHRINELLARESTVLT